MWEFKFLQNQVPKKFNLCWVRDTSKRYGLSDENTIVYNYLFYILLSFLFIFIILDFFFLNYYFTIIKTVLYYKIKTYNYC